MTKLYITMKFNPYNHSEVALNERITLILNEEKKKGHEKEALKTIFQSIDFTTLEAFDNEAKIKDFCEKALAFPKQKPHLSVPAICIYSPFIRQAKQLLAGSGIKVATVACAFPSGMMPFDLKVKEVEYCVNEGADEVDMVISRGTFLAGRYDEVFEEIKTIKETCGNGRTEDRAKHPQSQRIGHPCRCRLHQDFDGQGASGRHTFGRHRHDRHHQGIL